MSENRQDLVFLDTETVSLRTDINQIIQFAAIVVDADFVVKEKINLRIRLKKTIPIGVGACLVTGNKPLDLFSKEYTDMSEYEFAKYLMKLIEGRIIVGYNNHGYDDSMLSQCLFQNLQPAYFHKYSSNGSLDALTLVAAVTNMTNKYKHKINVKGNAELKLGSWCEANGIVVDHGKTHDALYDVELTLEAVNLIRARDPKIFEDWFKSRSTRHVNNRLMTELYINNINIYFGKVYSQWCAYIMGDDKSAFMFDLAYDPIEVFKYSDKQIFDSMIKKGKWRPIRHIRTNKAPMLCGESYATLSPEEKKQYEDNLVLILNNPMILDKFRKVCNRYVDSLAATYTKQDTSQIHTSQKDIHISERINESFVEFDSNDDLLMKKFHETDDWMAKKELIKEFEDDRLQIIAYNIIYDNEPSVLSKDEITDVRRRFTDFITCDTSKVNLKKLTEEFVQSCAGLNSSENPIRARNILTDYAMYLTKVLDV